MNTTTATAQAPTPHPDAVDTVYAFVGGWEVHTIATGPIDHYGRQADPKGRVGYMYEASCGLGTDEALILTADELTPDPAAIVGWDQCRGCFG